jgi:DNA-binding NarL/FixJ family response regulator
VTSLKPNRRRGGRAARITHPDVVLMDIRMPVMDGLSNVEIAQHLFVSPATVKTHVARLLMKLGARDRAQLIVVAYESGWSPRPRGPPSTTVMFRDL